MTFRNLDKDIAKNLGLNKGDVNKILKEAELVLFEKIVFGQEILINEVGKLELKITPSRKRFNIGTKEFFISPSKYRLSFKVSRKIDEELGKKTVYDG